MEHSIENMESKDILSLLQWYLDSGVDETVGEDALDWFDISQQLIDSKPAQKNATPPNTPRERPPKAMPMVSAEHIAQDATDIAAKCHDLTELHEAIKKFTGCSLIKTATNTVFSDGNIDSDIMVVGEAPAVEEDRHGKAFMGETGHFLDRMFKAIDLTREKDLYLTNVLPWRPPGNRAPTAEEIMICRPFIARHIELFDPKIIILLGGVAANSLLKSTVNITRLRGKWMEYDVAGNKIPVRPIFHPNYLLKQPKAKADAWTDLLEVKAKWEDMT